MAQQSFAGQYAKKNGMSVTFRRSDSVAEIVPESTDGPQRRLERRS